MAWKSENEVTRGFNDAVNAVPDLSKLRRPLPRHDPLGEHSRILCYAKEGR